MFHLHSNYAFFEVVSHYVVTFELVQCFLLTFVEIAICYEVTAVPCIHSESWRYVVCLGTGRQHGDSIDIRRLQYQSECRHHHIEDELEWWMWVREIHIQAWSLSCTRVQLTHPVAHIV
jgi:hypothetical protein